MKPLPAGFAWVGPVVAVVSVVWVMFGVAHREQTLGAYATPLDGRLASQRHNAELAAKAIDGEVIGPGETFSFNRTVGTFTRDQGYRRAPVSFNGNLIPAWGGGVCQTSSTLYNAALLAGMRIDERHRHHFAPIYVPPGRDAAVAYPNLDLAFTNTTDTPVRIEAAAGRRELIVRILGTSRHPEGIAVYSVPQKIQEPETILLGSPAQSSRVRTRGQPGYSVVVYRQFGTRREVVSVDTYPAMNRLIEPVTR